MRHLSAITRMPKPVPNKATVTALKIRLMGVQQFFEELTRSIKIVE